MRRTEQSIERASALASLVLPTPGTSSMSRWPSASSTARASRTVAVLPSMTCSMLATMALVAARNSSAGMRLAELVPLRCVVVTGLLPRRSSCARAYRTPGPAVEVRDGERSAISRRQAACCRCRSLPPSRFVSSPATRSHVATSESAMSTAPLQGASRGIMRAWLGPSCSLAGRADAPDARQHGDPSCVRGFFMPEAVLVRCPDPDRRG